MEYVLTNSNKDRQRTSDESDLAGSGSETTIANSSGAEAKIERIYR